MPNCNQNNEQNNTESAARLSLPPKQQHNFLALLFLCFIAWWLWPVATPSIPRQLPPGWQHFCHGDQIRGMICEGNNLWIGGLSGLKRFDWQTLADTTARISSPPVALARIETMIQTADKTIWIGHAYGLLSIDSNGKWQDHTGNLPDPKVLALCASAQDEVWVGTWRGAAVLKADRSWQHLRVADGLPAEKIRTIFKDSSGGIWLGSSSPPGGGLIRWSVEPKITFTTANLLAHPSVTAMFEDSQKRLWIGTGFFDQGGVTCYPGWQRNDLQTARILKQEDGLAGNKGRSFFEDNKGLIWIGSEIDGLTRVNADGSFTILQRQDGLIGDEVMSMTQDPDGNLWLGQELGLCRIATAALAEIR